MRQNSKKGTKKIGTLIRKNTSYTLMAAPGIIALIMLLYVPMFGLVLAFKDYSYRDGIWQSAWNGLENFKYIFGSGDIAITIRNTIVYHIVFTSSVMLVALAMAILLYFVKSKKAADKYQLFSTLPYLTTYNIIAYIVYIFLKADGGLLNTLIERMGGTGIAWYTEPKYWPIIFIILQVWFGAGFKAVYYYSAFMGIDDSILEAAVIDGAKWHHKVFKIMLPSIAPTICIFLIMDMGKILTTNFTFFYSIPMDSSALYRVTDVLATYEYRGLMSGNIGTTAALGLFTGVVQVTATILINQVVKKLDPENAMF